MSGTDDGAALAAEGRGPVWRRGGVALLLLIAAEIGLFLLWVTAVVQFCWMLFTGAPNVFLREFGASLSIWIGDAARFVTCAAAERPFPWAPWPKAGQAGP